VSALLELGAGFNPELTGRENVQLSSAILGVPPKEIAGRIAAVEAFADIGVFFDQPMRIYSSGMYARVAFADAIHCNPDVLIVDEILGVGDAKFQEKCYDKIRSLKARGVSILFVSHSTEVIQRNCELALLMEQGRLLHYGPADAVIAAYHDLLYGARNSALRGRQLRSAVGEEPSRQTEPRLDESEALQLLNGANDILHRRFSYYHPYERRFGSGDAEIVDFLLAANGKLHFAVLAGDEVLTIYLKVRFHRDVELPRIGWALVSLEGIVIAGSNTVMKDISLPSARKGEVWVYAVKLQPKLTASDYFINIGVGEYKEAWLYLDNRRSMIHVSVAASPSATGFIDVPSSCMVVQGPITDAHPVP
jgi:lipopolysaccharide transport system ATP-binding protein